MAEVDFGDIELFQQLEDSIPRPTHIRFEDHEENGDEISELRGKLEKCEETIRNLIEENQDLKRKLSIVTKPGGLLVDNVKIDGPLLQILFANSSISKQCRQEIEDCICGVIQKHRGQEKNTSFNIIPQSSSFVMEEDHKDKTPCGIQTIKEAYIMVGSVLYFTSFCLDKLGQPLLNDNPQLTDGWEVPQYQQVFSQVIALDGQEVQIKEKRPKPCCFNCEGTDHQLRDCPVPKDQARINEKRKEFSHGAPNLSNQRYHAEEVEERFAKYKPGIISEELLAALGVVANTLPPFIYRMRQLGYPPGWLKETAMENSGLTLYDGNVSSDGDQTEDSGHKVFYDVSKLVDFPGFNVPAPGLKDDYRMYGSVPMQPNHVKENYATYLSTSFPTPGSNCNKRRHESDSTPRQVKKRRSTPQSSDMDLDSDHDTSRHHQSSDSFQFQPPLPHGSPSLLGAPPPLPLGTPPVTPTRPPLPKGTPPLTPTNGSPALQGRTLGGCEEPGNAAGEEDTLTLEELEEQQRRIWAALENADTATNSDPETPALGTPVPSSSSVSTPARVDTENEMEEAEEKSVGSQRDEDADCKEVVGDEASLLHAEDSPQSPEPMKVQEITPQSPEPMKVQEISPQSPEPMKVQEISPQSPEPIKVQEISPQSPEPMKDQEVSPQSPEPMKGQDDAPQSSTPLQGTMKMELSDSTGKVTAVPHRSKFAEGIISFEETPEFTEVAEATGTYLRIRDVLKASPRNMAKNKK